MPEGKKTNPNERFTAELDTLGKLFREWQETTKGRMTQEQLAVELTQIRVDGEYTFKISKGTITKYVNAQATGYRVTQKKLLGFIEALRIWLQLNSKRHLSHESGNANEPMPVNINALSGIWLGYIALDNMDTAATFKIKISSTEDIRLTIGNVEFTECRSETIGIDKVSFEFKRRNRRVYLLLYIGDLPDVEVGQKMLLTGGYIDSGKGSLINVGGVFLERALDVSYATLQTPVITYDYLEMQKKLGKFYRRWSTIVIDERDLI